MQKKVILWLEDLLETIEEPYNYAESLGLTVEPAGTFTEFLDLLDDNQVYIVGIIIDVMVIGVNNLEPYSSTPKTGKGSETGWVVVNNFISNKANKCSDIPILMYSARDLTSERMKEIDHLRKEANLKIDYIEKSLEHKIQIKKWIEERAKNNQQL